MRIAIIGDSISTRNNGASAVAWPRLLSTMIEDGGIFGYEIRNYSIPGLRWRTAHKPTPGWLIDSTLSPLDAIQRDGCDMLIVCLGVNDRQNRDAIADALEFDTARPDVPVCWVRQNMYDPAGINDSIVTLAEQQAMDAVYTALGGDGFHVALGKLYDMGYSYDMLHPTNSGKQWIAAAVYMYLQLTGRFSLTPIGRNIAWLYEQTPEVRTQMRVMNT
ncbi:MAG TPA: SGNH/GDSL hydrolase family protein [Anaerolineae bacterium]